MNKPQEITIGLAGAAGDSAAYLILAGICLATWVATRARSAEPVGDLP